MLPILQIVLLTSLFAIACGLPSYNITITVPEGFSNHGKDDLFCVPTEWYQIFVFFAVNYASHAATVKSVPGQTYFHTVQDFLLAFTLPFSGLLRAVEALSRSSWPNENHLTKAVAAGAFCVVVRNRDWTQADFPEQQHQHQEQEDGAATRSHPLEDRIMSREGSANHDPEGSSEILEMQEMTKAQQPKRQIIEKAYKSREGSCRQTSGRRDDQPTNNDENPPNQTANEFSTSNIETTRNDFTRAESTQQNFSHVLPEGTSILAKAHHRYRNVHGIWNLPQGYSLAHLPSNAKIVGEAGENTDDLTLCSSYNVPRAILAIVQTIYASITLYRTRGDQIQQFGYAAFGFTVIPYIMMSVMNLCCAIVLPDYPTCYIVRSLESDDAMQRGAEIEGLIGRIVQEQSDYYLTPEQLYPSNQTSFVVTRFEKVGAERWTFLQSTIGFSFVFYILGAVPIAIIGGLTHFHPGRSTTAQRVWTMLWLVWDIVYGTLFKDTYESNQQRNSIQGRYFPQFRFLPYFAVMATPPIGGFVVVGQMLKAYGSCTVVSGLNT